jgi:O-antigen ligase
MKVLPPRFFVASAIGMLVVAVALEKNYVAHTIASGLGLVWFAFTLLVFVGGGVLFRRCLGPLAWVGTTVAACTYGFAAYSLMASPVHPEGELIALENALIGVLAGFAGTLFRRETRAR